MNCYKHHTYYNRQKMSYCPDCGERLERGGVSGAASCCAGRVADKRQDAAEESLESSAIAPGEAVPLALVHLFGILLQKEAKRLRKRAGDSGSIEAISTRGFAGGLESAARGLLGNLAQLDSEARNERSGRRNTEVKCGNPKLPTQSDGE